MKTTHSMLLIFTLLAVVALLKGGYIHLKAQLAQHLLEYAWSHSIASQRAQKPWPWADTKAVAKLSIPRQNIEIVVLDGMSGESMAFGPAMEKSAYAPNNTNRIIGGHRDTHMQFMQKLETGELIKLESIRGNTEYFVIEQTFVSNEQTEEFLIDAAAGLLVLVTCYPFDALLAGSPLRYIAIASPVFTNKQITMDNPLPINERLRSDA